MTLVSPASAPKVIMCEAVVSPRSRKARAIGASMFTSCQWHHAGQHTGDGNIKNGADQQAKR